MKLLYIANGKSIHTKRWITWFIKRGHKVFLITPYVSNIKGIEEEYVFPFKQKGGYIPRPTYILKIRQIIKKIKPDIVHSHFVICYGMYGALTNFHPFVVTGWGADILSAPSKSFIHKKLVKFVLKKADFVTVFSKYLYDYTKKLDNKLKNLEIIVPWDQNAYKQNYKEKIEELRKKIDVQPDSFLVISPRNIQPIYRTSNIVNSVPFILKKYPKTKFVFLKGLADEDYFKKINSTIEKLSLKNNVKIISQWLSDVEMAALYRLSNVTISIPKIDQFALTIREAMTCDSVPIISKLEIYKTIFTDENAIFVSGESSQEIADKIIDLIENPRKMDTMVEKNNDFIKQHEEIEKKLEQMEQIYIHLIKNKLGNIWK